MPLDVAMKQPDTGVVRAETQHNVAIRIHHEGVSPHGNLGEGLIVRVKACVVIRTNDSLECMAVEMEGMFARVVVVDDDFDDIVLLEDKGIGVGAVNVGVLSANPCRERTVEGWNLGFDVGDVIEEGARD